MTDKLTQRELEAIAIIKSDNDLMNKIMDELKRNPNTELKQPVMIANYDNVWHRYWNGKTTDNLDIVEIPLQFFKK